MDQYKHVDVACALIPLRPAYPSLRRSPVSRSVEKRRNSWQRTAAHYPEGVEGEGQGIRIKFIVAFIIRTPHIWWLDAVINRSRCTKNRSMHSVHK